MKEIKPLDFKIKSSVKLSDIDTSYDLNASKDEIKSALKSKRRELSEIQNAMYAHGKYSVLICIQGMDTAGKDSLIREVFKDFNVRGVVCHSFKVPTEKELKHDYLWRHYIALPERGKFSIFNRTHYENVLVTRVHPYYIMNENIPNIDSVEDITDKFWEQRFEQINNFEKHIAENGTIIFKFFLNISKDEQKYRLLRRLNRPDKQWKFSSGDLKERKLWDKYQTCYEDAINKTSKSNAPWYVIPSDDKSTARLIVTEVLLNHLKSFTDIKEPELPDDEKAKIEDYKKALEND